MQRLRIATKHEAGLFDFLKTLSKGQPTIPANKVKDLNAFIKEVLLMYTRLNNAYKLYFQGAVLKQQQEYVVEKYKDEDGNIQERKVKKKMPSNKIEFKGNWGFYLPGDKTSLGQAIHSLHKFLTNITNTKYTVEGEQPAEKQPAEKQPAEKQPAEKQPAEKQPAEKQPAEKQQDVRENV
jgi:hypothetical protein